MSYGVLLRRSPALSQDPRFGDRTLASFPSTRYQPDPSRLRERQLDAAVWVTRIPSRYLTLLLLASGPIATHRPGRTATPDMATPRARRSSTHRAPIPEAIRTGGPTDVTRRLGDRSNRLTPT